MAVDKLVDSAQLDADLTTVANAIRTKGGTSGSLAFPAGMVAAIQAIPTGGGASNVVTGTFKGTTTSTAVAMDIDLPYTGSGYPIAALIFIDGGSSSNSEFNNLIQRYATHVFIAVKEDTTTTPDFSDTTAGGINSCHVVRAYKNSTSNASTYAVNQSRNIVILANEDASGGGSGWHTVHIKSKTKMSVRIVPSSYGFPANITYRYYVIYSS